MWLKQENSVLCLHSMWRMWMELSREREEVIWIKHNHLINLYFAHTRTEIRSNIAERGRWCGLADPIMPPAWRIPQKCFSLSVCGWCYPHREPFPTSYLTHIKVFWAQSSTISNLLIYLHTNQVAAISNLRLSSQQILDVLGWAPVTH